MMSGDNTHQRTGAMCSGTSKFNLSPTKLLFSQGSEIKFSIFKHQVKKSLIFSIVFLSFRFFSFNSFVICYKILYFYYFINFFS